MYPDPRIKINFINMYFTRRSNKRSVTVWADLFVFVYNESTVLAGGRLDFPERRATSKAARGGDRIGSQAVGADGAAEPLREALPGSMLAGGLVDDIPNGFFQLERFDILGDIIDAIDQRKRVSQSADGRQTEAGS